MVPPRTYNRTGLYLAVAIAAACIPLTLKFQTQHAPNMANRKWQMLNLQSITASEAVKRYGPPTSTRDYSLSEGSFAGPKVGLKRFYRHESPQYAERLNDPVVWSFPRYSLIREMVWKLPDSTLTMWLHEPRATITLEGEYSEVFLPKVAEGDWVALDNYRVGNDLLAAPSAAQ